MSDTCFQLIYTFSSTDHQHNISGVVFSTSLLNTGCRAYKWCWYIFHCAPSLSGLNKGNFVSLESGVIYSLHQDFYYRSTSYTTGNVSLAVHGWVVGDLVCILNQRKALSAWIGAGNHLVFYITSRPLCIITPSAIRLLALTVLKKKKIYNGKWLIILRCANNIPIRSRL